MPYKIPDEQKAFTFTVLPGAALLPSVGEADPQRGDGHPLAKVITLGGSRWIACCPCCGMIHDLQAHQGDVYEPQCIVRVTHPHVYQAWRAKYPDAVQHTRVQLVTPEQWAAKNLRKPDTSMGQFSLPSGLPMADPCVVPAPVKAKRQRRKAA